MTLSKKMETALNGQINAELYSSYLYLGMSAEFASRSLMGFAKWLRVQGKEEDGHAMKLFDYVLERGGRVTLSAIEAPKEKFDTAQDAFALVLKHEQKVTGLINALVAQAAEEKDCATSVFLQWFVSEQVEEEASAAEVLEHIKMIEDSRGGLLMLDHKLGKRGGE